MKSAVKRRVTAMVASSMIASLAACATTSIRSQLDPQFAGRSYGKVMVFVDFRDLALRQDAEHQFQVSLGARGTNVARSIDLFLPGRTYDSADVSGTLREAGIEAVLIVASSETGVSSQPDPLHRPMSATDWSATVSGNSITGRSTTTSTPGSIINKPWARFHAVLYDVSGRPVWMASMSSSGNAYARWAHLARSMATKTSQQLVKDGVVK